MAFFLLATSTCMAEGGNVRVRVLSATEDKPLEGVVVKAHRRADMEELRGTSAPDSVAALASRITDAQGWVRLQKLPSEEIVFTLRGTGRARAMITEPYRVKASEELVLDELRLAEPSSIAITLKAEGVVIDTIEAVPAEGNRWPKHATISTPVRGAKNVTLDDIPPGPWTIRALGTRGVLGERKIDVLPGLRQHVTLEISR